MRETSRASIKKLKGLAIRYPKFLPSPSPRALAYKREPNWAFGKFKGLSHKVS